MAATNVTEDEFWTVAFFYQSSLDANV